MNINKEFNKLVLKYHTVALWIAVTFNLAFFIRDYLNTYDLWIDFFKFRFAVSSLCLIAVLFYKRLRIPYEILGVIPILLISIQNSYMWSLMDLEQMQKHSFSYMALFIGGGMFLFYRWYYSLLIITVSLIFNLVYFNLNSTYSAGEIMLNGGFIVLVTSLFSIFLIQTRMRLTRKELMSRLQLEEKKIQLEVTHKEIRDSINYAKRIQNALITSEKKIKSLLPNSFVLFKPKDIVSGDFYWAESTNTTTGTDLDKNKLVLFSVADCTGHGVPGAFMSIIGLKIFNETVKQASVNSPADALNYLDKEVYRTVNLNSEGDEVIRDGMDLSLCALDYKNMKLRFSGANNPVYIIRKGDLIQLKGDKKAIGSYVQEDAFTNKEIVVEKGDRIYLFSDGFADQFGGERGKKMKTGNFKKLLLRTAHLPIQNQYAELDNYFERWKGENEQLDDVCVMGIQV